MAIQAPPTPDRLTDCRFCSEISKANGEDLLGTAGTADYWLVIERPQPWTEATFKENPKIAPLLQLFKQLFMKHGILMRPILIAPDLTYSQGGETRIIYYARSQPQFNQFEKQEYIVPEPDFPRLVTAILKQLMQQPNELEAFKAYRQDTRHIREILVCTHGNVDTACARFGFPIYETLRKNYAKNDDGKNDAGNNGEQSQHNSPTSPLRVWRCSHFGGHKFAPTLIDLPSGRYWGHVQSETLDPLVHQTGDVKSLRPHYRGWAGLGKFEQIAEGEIWMAEGWDWLAYRKSGRTVRKGLTGLKRWVYPIVHWIPLKRVQVFLEQWTSQATWAEVEIDFSSPDGRIAGTYRARIEAIESVVTAAASPKSGEAMVLQPVPQYRVQSLVKGVKSEGS
jgi:hypothetical protein